MTDLVCALHIHSVHSDGTGTIPEIAAAAAQAGIDVAVVTDHDTLAGRGEEGWYGDVLVLIETELSPKRRDHYLAFGLGDSVAHDGMDAVAMCDAVRDAGGFGFAAHPFSTGARMPGLSRAAQPQRWADLDRPCLTGIEVWNVETEGAERARTPAELIRFARDPLSASPGPDPAALAEWDRLGRDRRVVGIAGLDAHQKGIRVGGKVLAPLRYDPLFRHVRTHVLTEASPTGSVDYDRRLVHDALRAGRCYIAVDALAPARGFEFKAHRGSVDLAMGNEAPAGGWTIEADLPLSAFLALKRDGETVTQIEADAISFTTDDPGVFRLEAHMDGRPWIFSNPVYLRAE
jgi:hypothetical protein